MLFWTTLVALLPILAAIEGSPREGLEDTDLWLTRLSDPRPPSENSNSPVESWVSVAGLVEAVVAGAGLHVAATTPAAVDAVPAAPRAVEAAVGIQRPPRRILGSRLQKVIHRQL